MKQRTVWLVKFWKNGWEFLFTWHPGHCKIWHQNYKKSKKLKRNDHFQTRDYQDTQVKVDQSFVLKSRKWNIKSNVEDAKSSLKMKTFIGAMATCRAGVGMHPEISLKEMKKQTEMSLGFYFFT